MGIRSAIVNANALLSTIQLWLTISIYRCAVYIYCFVLELSRANLFQSRVDMTIRKTVERPHNRKIKSKNNRSKYTKIDSIYQRFAPLNEEKRGRKRKRKDLNIIIFDVLSACWVKTNKMCQDSKEIILNEMKWNVYLHSTPQSPNFFKPYKCRPRKLVNIRWSRHNFINYWNLFALKFSSKRNRFE